MLLDQVQKRIPAVPPPNDVLCYIRFTLKIMALTSLLGRINAFRNNEKKKETLRGAYAFHTLHLCHPNYLYTDCLIGPFALETQQQRFGGFASS